MANMSKMIQIRNVPDEIHRKLKMRAAREGRSLSSLLLREVTRLAETPSLTEWIEQTRHPKGPAPQLTIDDIVHAVREGRGEI